jgi:hypothetical protein
MHYFGFHGVNGYGGLEEWIGWSTAKAQNTRYISFPVGSVSQFVAVVSIVRRYQYPSQRTKILNRASNLSFRADPLLE